MGDTAGNPANIPKYNSALFVNRKEEIRIVKQKAQELSLGKPVRERTIVFWSGYKGAGRTWLLKHLQQVLSSELHGVLATYLNLEEWKDYTVDQAIKEIANCLAHQTREWLGQSGANQGQGQSPHDAQCEQLRADVQRLLEQNIIVLLLDHVYESEWDLLMRLEEDILTQAVVLPRVLLVMAGRGRGYPWKTPELRLYVEDHHLQPFTKDQTEEQLTKQQPGVASRAQEIFKMSQGYPLGNILLAISPTTMAMQEAVNNLLAGVPNEERAWLEALCVLRSFDEERIPELLVAYSGVIPIRDWPYAQVRQARDRLLQTRLVRWKEEAGGWVVDEAIRPVVERYLQQTQPETWRRLHCAAYRLYKDWEQHYPDEKQRWQSEVEYHAKCLRDAGYDPDQCV